MRRILNKLTTIWPKTESSSFKQNFTLSNIAMISWLSEIRWINWSKSAFETGDPWEGSAKISWYLHPIPKFAFFDLLCEISSIIFFVNTLFKIFFQFLVKILKSNDKTKLKEEYKKRCSLNQYLGLKSVILENLEISSREVFSTFYLQLIFKVCESRIFSMFSPLSYPHVQACNA